MMTDDTINKILSKGNKVKVIWNQQMYPRFYG